MTVIKTIRVGENDYQIEKMNAFEQFNVAKKLASALMLLSTLKNQDGTPPSSEEFARLLVAGTVNLTNDDTDFINRICLSRVRRQQPNNTGWSVVIEPRSGKLMFEDIDLREMTQLVWGVVEAHQMVDFFGAPKSTSGETMPPV